MCGPHREEQQNLWWHRGTRAVDCKRETNNKREREREREREGEGWEERERRRTELPGVFQSHNLGRARRHNGTCFPCFVLFINMFAFQTD